MGRFLPRLRSIEKLRCWRIWRKVDPLSPRSGLVQPCAANPAGASWLQSLRPVRRAAELGSLDGTAPHEHSMPKSYNIDQILTQKPDKVQTDLCGALERAGGLHSPGALNGAETAFLAAFNCWGGIECEGLSGWLLNTSDPKTFKQAVDALRAVGASKRADALWRVAGLFQGSELPADTDAFSEVVTDDQHNELYEEIEEQMREEDLGALLHRYVTAHVQEFR